MGQYEIPDYIVTAVCALADESDFEQALLGLIGADVKICQNEMCGKKFLIQTGRTERTQRRMVGVKYCTANCAQAQAQREYRRRNVDRINA